MISEDNDGRDIQTVDVRFKNAIHLQSLNFAIEICTYNNSRGHKRVYFDFHLQAVAAAKLKIRPIYHITITL